MHNAHSSSLKVGRHMHVMLLRSVLLDICKRKLKNSTSALSSLKAKITKVCQSPFKETAVDESLEVWTKIGDI